MDTIIVTSTLDLLALISVVALHELGTLLTTLVLVCWLTDFAWVLLMGLETVLLWLARELAKDYMKTFVKKLVDRAFRAIAPRIPALLIRLGSSLLPRHIRNRRRDEWLEDLKHSNRRLRLALRVAFWSCPRERFSHLQRRLKKSRTVVVGASAALTLGLILTIMGRAELHSAPPPAALQIDPDPDPLRFCEPGCDTSLVSVSQQSGWAKLTVVRYASPPPANTYWLTTRFDGEGRLGVTPHSEFYPVSMVSPVPGRYFVQYHPTAPGTTRALFLLRCSGEGTQPLSTDSVTSPHVPLLAVPFGCQITSNVVSLTPM
jgi:hypothetical protein